MILATGTICTPATWRGTDVLEDRRPRPRRGLYGGARGTGRDLTGTVTVCVGNQGELAEFSDLNVTIGGELTFVPADRESGETNTRVEHTPTENGTATATEVEVERHTRSVNRTTVDLTTVQQGTAVALGNVTLPVRERYRRVLLDVTVEGATLASGDGADVSAGNGTLEVPAGFAVDRNTARELRIDLSTTQENGTYTLTADSSAQPMPTGESGPASLCGTGSTTDGGDGDGSSTGASPTAGPTTGSDADQGSDSTTTTGATEGAGTGTSENTTGSG